MGENTAKLGGKFALVPFGHLGCVRGGLEPGWGLSVSPGGGRPCPGGSRALHGAQDRAGSAAELVSTELAARSTWY